MTGLSLPCAAIVPGDTVIESGVEAYTAVVSLKLRGLNAQSPSKRFLPSRPVFSGATVYKFVGFCNSFLLFYAVIFIVLFMLAHRISFHNY